MATSSNKINLRILLKEPTNWETNIQIYVPIGPFSFKPPQWDWTNMIRVFPLCLKTTQHLLKYEMVAAARKNSHNLHPYGVEFVGFSNLVTSFYKSITTEMIIILTYFFYVLTQSLENPGLHQTSVNIPASISWVPQMYNVFHHDPFEIPFNTKFILLLHEVWLEKKHDTLYSIHEC